MSAAYYALFHMLTEEGAAAIGIAVSHAEVQARVRRVFEHRQMRVVCETFISWNASGRPEGLGQLLGSSFDGRIVEVAAAFVELQQARQVADYDLMCPAEWFALDEALRLVNLAETAFEAWSAIRDTSNATVFLTALLLGERLYRRG